MSAFLFCIPLAYSVVFFVISNPLLLMGQLLQDFTYLSHLGSSLMVKLFTELCYLPMSGKGLDCFVTVVIRYKGFKVCYKGQVCGQNIQELIIS